MDLVKISNDFDPTPKLKSSPIPINFISFDNYKNDYCIFCGEYYIIAPLSIEQIHFKNCLCYLINIKDNNMHLDAYYTMDLECSEHEIRIKEPQVIQKCCKNRLKVFCFKQMFDSLSFKDLNLHNSVVGNEEYCKLCKKSLYQENDISVMKGIKLCTDCYLISSEYIESPLIKKSIPIIYLPWWHNISHCNVCNLDLTITSDCQKYCKICLIFHIGCRYCLTTNIIFGLTVQSQCKKCKRVSFVNIFSGNDELDEFLFDLFSNIHHNFKPEEFTDKIKIIDKNFVPSEIDSIIRFMCQNYKVTRSLDTSEKLVEWIPYSQFTNVKEIARGGFGVIYLATWAQKSIILKKFKNSQKTSRYFLNELKSNQYCYEIRHHIIRVHGVTKDPKLGEYMLIMQYASGGDLHKWLQKSFANITWNKEKLIILWQISEGLETIHKADYIHRDFHSGNILYDLFHNNSIQEKYKERHQWLIGDLGLSQPTNNTSSNNEIYGVIPYIAPEIFKGSSFSKESDVYGMERPEITEDTPECYANLMKSCWDPDPKKRPSAKKIRNTFGSWSFRNKHNDIFNKAELKRRELIESQKLGPEFAKKPHPRAIYTSRPLSFFISKCSSNSSQGYNYISEEQGFDIDVESYTSKSLSVPVTSLGKRNIEELNIEETNNDNEILNNLMSIHSLKLFNYYHI
ncbi:uncharacterized protein OCT59_017728 [Rhizophagus irregularis]|uniref:uncharacterized protein n=1 Tax=Rhizophagus irregularis TaxID=588596 RepID=UPI0033331A0B|nr:hypothetical protein OCT59_017728 [Rhizophagus irregularis]